MLQYTATHCNTLQHIATHMVSWESWYLLFTSLVWNYIYRSLLCCKYVSFDILQRTWCHQRVGRSLLQVFLDTPYTGLWRDVCTSLLTYCIYFSFALYTHIFWHTAYRCLVCCIYMSFDTSRVNLVASWVWRISLWVTTMITSRTYRVAKTHRMPHLFRSFSAKEPYD